MMPPCRHLDITWGPKMKVWICRDCGLGADDAGSEWNWRELPLTQEQQRDLDAWLARNHAAKVKEQG